MGEQKLTGHCYCGAVTFEITGKSEWIGHCHCVSCRKQTGAPVVTFAGFQTGQLEL